jgi:hypothetical protein
MSQSAELVRSSPIPMKQLLRRLVVVRHHLRHNGEVRHELKARQFTDETVRGSITSAISCMTIQRLWLQIVRSHADTKLLMLHLNFVDVFSLSICRCFLVELSSRL